MVSQIGPTEPDPGARNSRLQRQVDFVAGVKADADTRNLTTNGALCVHQPLEQKGTSTAKLSKLNA
jgi:hypothetical protein